MKKGRGKLTRIGGGDGGGAGEVAGGGLLAVFLEIAVGGVAAVGLNGVGLEAGPVLMDRVAIRPGSASVV